MSLAINRDHSSVLSDENRTLIANTLLTGASVLILAGPQVAIICMVANVALSLAVKDQEKVTDWLKWDDKAVTDLKGYWEGSLPYFKVKLAFVVIEKLFFRPEAKQLQTVIQIFIKSLSNPLLALGQIFLGCVVAPVIEEIIFRGFIQEKIRNIQVFCFGEKDADNKVHKVIRVGLQAILFGLAHVRPEQAAINGVIFLMTTVFGFYNGYLKEKTKTLWCSIAHHAHFNASTFGCLLADHFIPARLAPLPTLAEAAAPAA